MTRSTVTQPAAARPVVAIFDGQCVICNTTRRIVRLLDWFRRIEFLDLHHRGDVQQRYPQVEHEAAMGQIHVVADDGRIYAGFAGTRRLLRELPLGLPLWALMHLPVIGDRIGPALYGFIARNRYAINRLFGVELTPDDDCVDGVCQIPTTRQGQRQS